jgi:hypothetical protein
LPQNFVNKWEKDPKEFGSNAQYKFGIQEKLKRFASSPVWSPEKGTCYKKNLFVGTDPTYLAVKPVTTFLIARHEAETTRTSGGPSPEAVMKGKKER